MISLLSYTNYSQMMHPTQILNFKKKQLSDAIYELRNYFPKDDLISDYDDFLEHRDFLHYYKFNMQVFVALLKLTNELWYSKKRINRLSLLQTIKRYGSEKLPGKRVGAFEYLNLSKENGDLLFEIFRKSFGAKTPVSENQIKLIREITSKIIVGICISDKNIKWLIENANKSRVFLERVLYYPEKSEIISKWIKKNYYSDFLKGYRSVVASWIIDIKPDFEISRDELIEDVKYCNTIDIAAIFAYIKNPSQDLEISKRVHGIPIAPKRWAFPAPNILNQTVTFFRYLESSVFAAMMYAISYSHLDKTQKSKLIKKYYKPDLFWVFVNACKKAELTSPLVWLSKQSENYFSDEKEIPKFTEEDLQYFHQIENETIKLHELSEYIYPSRGILGESLFPEKLKKEKIQEFLLINPEVQKIIDKHELEIRLSTDEEKYEFDNNDEF